MKWKTSGVDRNGITSGKERGCRVKEEGLESNREGSDTITTEERHEGR
jgi:hypothetical protein